MSTPPGFYADPLDLFACMDYSWTPEIPTDPRERTLFWLRCESLGLSGDEGLAYGVGQLVAGEADLEDGYYVLQRTMHQPGGRYWHSPYTVLPLPCSLAEWHGQWERLNFCDYSTFVGNPEGEFHTLYAQRFFYIGMNDTEERRDWLADLVYQELELIKEYGSIQELENQRKEALRVCAPSFCGFQQAQPCLGTVGPKDFHLPPSTVSAGVGEEQKASQTTLFWSPSEIPVCTEFSGCVAPVLAEPESGRCHFKGLAEAEASPSENPVCLEFSGCVTPVLVEPESGCCHFKGLAEAEASPSEIPVCMESSGCVTPGLAEPESGCCHFKGLAEAEASPSEIPNCVEPGAAQFEKSSKEGRDEDSPLPELLLAGEDQEQDQEESIAQDSPMSIRAVSSGNGVRGTRKAQRVTRAVVPETPSGRQQGQRITPQRNKTLVSPRAVPTISPRWRGPPLCNVTGTGALREVGWNLELKKRQGDKHLSNTLWGPLVIGVT
ncbi:uncharacterized protein LOC105945821 [Xenopus tropicalis]|uniref:Uncharacterized LOC105945821 n=1 Tax=Xenopus tropicalis TaxID=8364 RepID=A0A1B8XYF5_XENTR|nr:uncharacterized protein LOC105945821 [Xenopus tropicalis]